MLVKTSHVKKSYALDGSISVTLSVTPMVMISAKMGVSIVGVGLGLIGVGVVGVGVAGVGGYNIEIIAAMIAITTRAIIITNNVLFKAPPVNIKGI
jgi:hypothetical protein